MRRGDRGLLALSMPILRHFRLPVLVFSLATVYGTLGYTVIEGWRPLDSLYMTLTTLTTVGFREVHPLDTDGRIFTMTLMTAGVVGLFVVVASFAQLITSGEIGEPLRRNRMARRISKLENHIIVCAYGRVGRIAAAELVQAGIPLVVVEPKQELAAVLEEQGLPYLTADPTEEEVLLDAGIERARGLVCAVDSDAINVYITLTARALNPNLSIVSRASSAAAEDNLVRAGADRVVSPYSLSGQRMAALALTPAVVEFIDLVTVAPDMRLEEIDVRPGSPLDGRSVSDALRAWPQVHVLAVKQSGGDLVASPDPVTVLHRGDLAVVLGPSGQLREMSGAGGGGVA